MIEEQKFTESLFEAPKIDQQERMVEAILFASSDPVTVKEIIGRLPHGCEPEKALENLKEKYKSRGINLVKVGDCWALRTASDLSFLMQKETVEVRKLSRAASSRSPPTPPPPRSRARPRRTAPRRSIPGRRPPRASSERRFPQKPRPQP